MTDARLRRFDLAVVTSLGAVLAIGLAIRPSFEEGGVALRLFGLPLPATCWFRLATGLPCAGCGMTRAVVLALHGEPRAAWQAHPFALPLLGLAGLQLILRAASLAGWTGRRLKWADVAFVGALTILLVAMLGWWAVRLARGLSP
jgi:hypothetical protein